MKPQEKVIDPVRLRIDLEIEVGGWIEEERIGLKKAVSIFEGLIEYLESTYGD